MKCPACKTELVQYKQLRLETLDEHVCHPNGEVPLKWAYRCPSACDCNGSVTESEAQAAGF